ncbi:MAG: histidine phosphatase family protein [Rhodospirillaceae bacterium]
MKTLSLLRHAKSSWENPGLADRERPLEPRGRKAATAVGHHLALAGKPPQLVLCSPALRTTETLERVLAALGADVQPVVEIREALYLGGGETLLETVQGLPAELDHVLLVAHDPDLHELALLLAGSGEPGPLAALKRKFPTGALAVFGLADWREAGPGAGRLKEFVRPRDLS